MSRSGRNQNGQTRGRFGAAVVGTLLAGILTGCAAGGDTTGSEEPREYRMRASQEGTSDFTPGDVATEVELGREVSARLLSRYGLHEEPSVQNYVRLVGQSIAMNTPRSELEYHFAVLDTSAVNAYAAPGGYVFITRGALGRLEDEAELAGVLAHEIAHVNQRHIVHELDIRGAESGMVSGLSRVLGSSGDPAQAAFSSAVNQAVDVLLETGLEREDELEADAIGTRLLALTGYDPAALRRYLERLGDHREAAAIQQGVAGTHPPFPVRLEALDETLVDAGLTDAQAPRMEERFHARMP